MKPAQPPRAFRPRLDVTLLAFALAGIAVAALLPQRAPPADSGGRYALAISHGDDLKLAATAGRATASVLAIAPANAISDATPDLGARVLACRRVISVGPLDVGARCKSAERAATGSAPAGMAQASAATD